MAANEIEERLAAACWIRCGSAGGEGINDLDPATINYRSRIGFQNRIILTDDMVTRPMLILPLDRVFSRRETAVQATRIGTVQYNDLLTSRASYPAFSTPPESVSQVLVEPIHLDWLGPDLSAPLFQPFGFSPQSVPNGFSMDLFNAVAVLLPAVTEVAESGDFCVAVFEHLQPDAADQPVSAVLPAAPPPVDPIEALGPYAWWRMDDFVSSGGEGGEHVDFFVGRAGGEGNLSQSGAGPGVPEPNPDFNNQFTWSSNTALTVVDGGGTDPAFWQVFLDGNSEWYLVWATHDIGPQVPMDTFPTNQLSLGCDPNGTEELQWTVGTIGVLLDLAQPGFDAAVIGVPQLSYFQGQLPGPPEYRLSSTSTALATGAFDTPPPETMENVVQFAASGVDYAEMLFFNRTLTGPERAIVFAYFATRYPGL